MTEEDKKFLQNLLPGAVFATLLIVAMFLATHASKKSDKRRTDMTHNHVEKVNTLQNIKNNLKTMQVNNSATIIYEKIKELVNNK